MISHKHRCIFIHIPKTAGQSIEHVFVELNGLTWETRAPLLLRPNKDPKLGPGRLAHLKATEYVSCGHVDQATYPSYFKFAFIRNPYDRIVSVYNYLEEARGVDFRTFLHDVIPAMKTSAISTHVEPQYHFLHDPSGKLLVDFVGRFEHLQRDFDTVSDRLGLGRMELRRINESPGINAAKSPAHGGLLAALSSLTGRKPVEVHKPVRRHYSEYFTEETRRYFEKIHEADIRAWDYAFERPDTATAAIAAPV